MAETIPVEDIEVDFQASLEEAFRKNGFTSHRINPKLLNEDAFVSKLKGVQMAMAHFFSPGAGYQIKDLPAIMQDRIIRPPRDIREVIAVGKVLGEAKCDYAIYAPEITGEPGKLLHISRFPGWPGFGFTVQTFEDDRENLWDLQMIGFSNR